MITSPVKEMPWFKSPLDLLSDTTWAPVTGYNYYMSSPLMYTDPMDPGPMLQFRIMRPLVGLHFSQSTCRLTLTATVTDLWTIIMNSERVNTYTPMPKYGRAFLVPVVLTDKSHETMLFAALPRNSSTDNAVHIGLPELEGFSNPSLPMSVWFSTIGQVFDVLVYDGITRKDVRPSVPYDLEQLSRSYLYRLSFELISTLGDTPLNKQHCVLYEIPLVDTSNLDLGIFETPEAKRRIQRGRNPYS
jgi:hypothetical protein